MKLARVPYITLVHGRPLTFPSLKFLCSFVPRKHCILHHIMLLNKTYTYDIPYLTGRFLDLGVLVRFVSGFGLLISRDRLTGILGVFCVRPACLVKALRLVLP